MRDPHVVSLCYLLKTDETTTFDNPPPLALEEPAFSLHLDNKIATVSMTEHFRSEEQARGKVDPWMRAWELEVALTRKGQSQIHFEFDGAEIIDRNPPPRGAPQVVTPKPVTLKLQVGTSVKVHVTHRTYPEPPSRFRASQDVEVMWLRYEGYRDGKEPLTAMAYFCLTVVEARSGPKGQKRPNAAKQLKVEPKVLSKLGELSSQVGDNQKARKFGGSGRSHTDREERWLKETVLALIRRVGEYDCDPKAPLPALTMADLPNL